MDISSIYTKLSNNDIISIKNLGVEKIAIITNQLGDVIFESKPSLNIPDSEIIKQATLEFYGNVNTPSILKQIPGPIGENIDLIKSSPEKIESLRLQAAQTRELLQNNIQGIDLDTIKGAIPQNAKAQGTAKLSALISEQGKKIKILLIPKALEIANKLKAQVNEEILTQFKKQITPSGECINSVNLQREIINRNQLVNSLNKTNQQLDRLTTALTGLSTFYGLTSTILKILKTSKKVISAASKFIPSPPGVPGVITAAMGDLDDIIRDTTFTNTGNSKLEKISGTIAAASLSVSIVNTYILTIIRIIESIDIKIKQCDPYSTLIPINPELIKTAELQAQSNQTQNNATYKGFIIEIEIVPFSPTVNRRRAVGKNENGITLISTELSFTTLDEVLINELKFIIDRDNLKAY